MRMPETTVDEERQVAISQDEIGFARKSGWMRLKRNLQAAQERFALPFGTRARTVDSAHYFAALDFGECIRHTLQETGEILDRTSHCWYELITRIELEASFFSVERRILDEEIDLRTCLNCL